MSRDSELGINTIIRNNIKNLDLRVLGEARDFDCRDNPIESLQVSE